jgi:Rieske Fe-S protein
LLIRFGAGRKTSAGELTFPVPPADGALIDRRNEVIVVRCQARAFAFALSCPHQRTMLKWRESEQRFQCPRHKSMYRPDGAFVSGRATRGMDRLPVRLAGGDIVLDTTAAIRQDEDETAWNAAEIRLPAG